MKWISLYLLLFTFNAFGATEKETNTFQISCAGTYYVGITNLFGDNVSKERVEANGIALCLKEKTPNEKPMLNGCLKAVQLIYSDDMSESYRQERIAKLNRELCASIGNR